MITKQGSVEVGTKIKRLLALLLTGLLLTSMVPIAGADPGWAFRKVVTIDHTKVSGDLTDFPVLINLDSDLDLAAHAQDDGDDICFVNADNTVKLDHEIEYFNGSTGELQAWVRIPSLPSSTDTTIYMYYGNSECGNQQNVTGVWDSNYVMVQHLEETSKTDGDYNDHLDSTLNNNDGEALNGVTMDGAGQIDGADSFDGVNDFARVPHSASLNFDKTDTFSITTWVNFTPRDDQNAQQIVGKRGPLGQGYNLKINYDGTIEGGFYDGSTYRRVHASNYLYGEWHFVTITHDGATVRGYLDGTLIDSDSSPLAGTVINADDLAIGRYSGSIDAEQAIGIIDEIRISNVSRSGDWINTSYNNQKDSSTFYSVGSQEGDPVPPVPELPTIFISSIGLIVLVGYAGLRRRKSA